jgi:hypothetical protein
MMLFGWPYVSKVFTKFKQRISTGMNVNAQYTDTLNVLMRSYEEVPLGWFITLFLCSFITILAILCMGYLYIPIWTYFVALATGAVVVIVSFDSSISIYLLTR